jgi:O-antigen/teichoic acid export membrane protein
VYPHRDDPEEASRPGHQPGLNLGIGSTFKLAFGKVDDPGLRQRRFMAIVQGVVSGVANRALAVVIGLVSVPLTIHYLGAERYGVWALVGSTLAWLRLADIGIGNGLNNAIAGAFGAERHDLVKAHISTGFALLSGIAVILGLVVALVWPWIDWIDIFNVKTEIAKAEVGPAMAAAILVFLVSFPLSIIARVYTATQDGKLANYWGAAGNVMSLVALFFATHTHGGLVWLVVAVSGTAVMMDALSGAWLFLVRKPHFAPHWKSVRRTSVHTVMNVGVQFFLIQILALILFESQNFLVAHYLGADQVPSYNLTYKLFGYCSLIQGLLFNYVWVAYSEAIARRDIDWVRKTFRMNMAFSLLFTTAMVIPLIFIAQPFIRLWAGDVAVPSMQLVYWMAAWTMINAYCSPISCLLAAAGHLKLQLAYSSATVLVNLALALHLVKSWGSSGVIAATVIAYLIFMCVPIAWDASVLLKKLQRKPLVEPSA